MGLGDRLHKLVNRFSHGSKADSPESPHSYDQVAHDERLQCTISRKQRQTCGQLHLPQIKLSDSSLHQAQSSLPSFAHDSCGSLSPRSPNALRKCSVSNSGTVQQRTASLSGIHHQRSSLNGVESSTLQQQAVAPPTYSSHIASRASFSSSTADRTRSTSSLPINQEVLQTLQVSSQVVGRGSYGIVYKGTFLDKEVCRGCRRVLNAAPTHRCLSDSGLHARARAHTHTKCMHACHVRGWWSMAEQHAFTLPMQVAVKTTLLTNKQMGDSHLTSVKATAELEARLLENLEHPNVVSTYGCLRRVTEQGWEQRLVQVREAPGANTRSTYIQSHLQVYFRQFVMMQHYGSPGWKHST